MAQAFFMYGDGILLMIVLLGIYMGCLTSIKDIKYVSNNMKLDNTIIFVYSVFAIQLGIVLSIAIIPIIMFLFNVNWLTTFSCLIFALITYIVMLLTYKKLQEKILKIKENRTDKDKQHYENNKYIKLFYPIATAIFVLGELFLLTHVIMVYKYIEQMGSTYGYDFIIFGIIIFIFYVLIRFTIFIVDKVSVLENEEKEHLKNCPEIDRDKLKDCKIDTDIRKENVKDK